MTPTARPSPLTLGVDFGATLAKLARRGSTLELEHVPSADLAAVRALIAALGPGRIVATGGGAPALGCAVGDVRVEAVPEFEAWARGATVLASEEGAALPEHYLLVSLGTGTSMLAVDGRVATRIGGTALGGGTVLGLGRLLCGVEPFAELAALAAGGQRRTVDLLVGDVYPAGDAPLPAELTAAHFAKLGSRRPADLAHAVMGLVGENVAIVAGGVARQAGVRTVVYGGSTLAGNAALRDVLAEITTVLGFEARFLARGAYCGAVGAAAA
jgi:type II pantothenate kinase